MKAKLELYRIFKEVASCNNISTASKNLYISQSAVSQSIKQLENSLGIIIFLRTSKGVTLTSEGELLYDYVNSAITLLETAEQKIDNIIKLSGGDLKIGASDTISQYLLLEKLESFSRIYPDIKLQIVNRTSNESISLLKLGKIDIAFINSPIEDEQIECNNYIKIHDIFVSGDSNDFNKIFTIQDISQLNLVLLEEKANSRKYINDFFLQNGIKLIAEIELGSHELLLEFAKIKLGVSCVIQEFSKKHLLLGDLVKIKTDFEIPHRYISIAKLRGVPLSNAAKKFIAQKID